MTAPPDYIWGVHPVCEQLIHQPESVAEILLLKEIRPDTLGRIKKLAARTGARIKRVDRLPKPLREVSHQGVAARIKAFATLSLTELLARIAPDTAPLVVALDRIQDPGNLGAIIRTCAAAGVDGIITTRDQSAPLGGTVLKASAGTAARVAISQVTNLARALETIKEKGFWIYGAASGGEPIWQTDMRGPACLLLGNEHQGIRPLLRKNCDFMVSIPMAAGVDSLNVSAAAAVMVFEAVRQRLLK